MNVAGQALGELPQEVRDSLAFATLRRWSAEGLRYCIWKSLDRLAEGARGETDLDVLVHRDDRARVGEMLRGEGWIETRAEVWRRFPAVRDFLRFDAACGRFLHLHLHERLILGEPRTKSLALPLEQLYLSAAVDIDGLRAAPAELELAVFVLRMVAKIGWKEHARIVYWRSRREFFRAFRAEFEELRRRCRRRDLERLLGHPEFGFVSPEPILAAFDDLDSLKAPARRRLRRQLAAYRRYGRPERLLRGVYLAWLERRTGVGKTLLEPHGGFAFCGADGSGKTSLLDGVQGRLGEHLRVRRVYLGGSSDSAGPVRWCVMRLAWWPYLLLRRLARTLSPRATAQGLERIYFGVDSYLIAREKRRRHRAGLRAAEAGQLVLFERFPIFPGYGDAELVGPRSLLPEAERRLLSGIHPPARIFVLRIDADRAIARKPDHDAEDIAEKVRRFDRFVASRPERVTVLDATRGRQELQGEVLSMVCRDLQRDR